MAVDCASDCDLLADVDNVSNFKTYIWEGCLSYKATSEFEVFFDEWLTIERFKDVQKRMKEECDSGHCEICTERKEISEGRMI